MGSDDRLWTAGEAYEPFVGRWSRLVAREFLRWLAPARARDWVDVGCGTGALSAAILAAWDPRSVQGVDPSDAFLLFAGRRLQDDRVSFSPGAAQHLPLDAESADIVVSGLVLNFADDPAAAVAECARVARAGGAVAAYVWDYAGEMQMLRYFWDAAVALDPAARELDEASRFPICAPDALSSLFSAAGLRSVATHTIDVPTVFTSFDDYWSPFLAGGAPAPHYAMSLTEQRRNALREALRERLPIADDGSIALVARAWAVRGTR